MKMMMSDPVPTSYVYSKAVNVTQLKREVETLLAQMNVELGSRVELKYIETVGERVAIYLTDRLSQEYTARLDQLVAAHNPSPSTRSGLPEYQTNNDAVSAGLGTGKFYRTGEYVKVVY